jgi:Rho GDP-dissociation inhibitor
VDEYAKLDAEDESLARWKASLGIVPGAPAGTASGPKASSSSNRPLSLLIFLGQVVVLTLELRSPSLPADKTISIDLTNSTLLADLKKNPINIKEGVDYKYVYNCRERCFG